VVLDRNFELRFDWTQARVDSDVGAS